MAFNLIFLAFAAILSAGTAVAQDSPSADAQTSRIVDAANAFLAALSDEQKEAVLFPFTDSEQRVNWSNFPDGAVARSGMRWGDLDDAQRAALTDLLSAVLSPKGVEMVMKQMAADDVVAAQGGGRGGNGRPPVNFGSDYYYVSFLGTPSAASPWMLQYGGHHLAINATVVGPKVTLSPTLTGGEPLKFVMNGEPVHIALDEVNRSFELLNSLTDAQRDTAVVSGQRINLVLGPGKDGKTLQPEGLPGSGMTDAQKTQLLALIEARLGMMNADDLAVKMAEIEENLDKTYFGWWGPMEPGAGYFRVTGPTVLIEYSPQFDDGDPAGHAHNMYRDPTNEYGAAWTSLE